MAKQITIDVSTGKIIEEDVPDTILSLDIAIEQKLQQLYGMYNYYLNRGFTSNANGSPIQFGYDSNYQLIYSKWANVLALDSTRTSVTFSTPNGTVVTLTRDQFIQFMNDAEQFELNLFNNRMNLESQINNATTVDQLNAINIIL